MKQQIIQQGAEAVIILRESRELISANAKGVCGQDGRESERDLTKIPKKVITKKRTKKSYRLPELDNKIRKLRTRNEAKLLKKASEVTQIPKVLKANEKSKEIIMEFIDGKKLSEHLDEFPLNQQKQILTQIGEQIAKLHDFEIIHGDLTTSNMILVERENELNKTSTSKGWDSARVSTSRDKKVFFIDFGLGFRSHKYEDKAVDIHLLKQALEAKHFKNWEELYEAFEKGYKRECEKLCEFNKLASDKEASLVGKGESLREYSLKTQKRAWARIGKERQAKQTPAEIVFKRLAKVEKRGRYKH